MTFRISLSGKSTHTKVSTALQKEAQIHEALVRFATRTRSQMLVAWRDAMTVYAVHTQHAEKRASKYLYTHEQALFQQKTVQASSRIHSFRKSFLDGHLGL
jgi:hypothetical protein